MHAQQPLVGNMSEINILDNETIDKIAAGEVIERPMSVVKELVENSIDAGATAITVEIKGGGLDYIRVSDNGSGVDSQAIRRAFMRHATSKIKSISDLLSINSLGFRGEALSSIAAVSKVEFLSKTSDGVCGIRYEIAGGHEMSYEEVGIPDGTTFIVRALFYNTPARRKFMKSAMTEASYVSELMEHIMLSHPHISFKYIVNGNVKLTSLGKGDVKGVIYGLYGRDMVDALIPVEYENGDFTIKGYVGKPEIARGNTTYETYFVNGRYIRSSLIKRALDEAYKPYLMLHKYPVVFLYIDILPDYLDVNVHPTKMEVRFLCGEILYSALVESVRSALKGPELIPTSPGERTVIPTPVIEDVPEPFEKPDKIINTVNPVMHTVDLVVPETLASAEGTYESVSDNTVASVGIQLELFEDKFLSEKNVIKHRIIGQLFKTYWLVEMDDKLYIIDQHAAHEKVMYERLIRQIDNNEVSIQYMNPPLIVTLSLSEADFVEKNIAEFKHAGFEVEHFGGNDFSLRGIPVELFGISPGEYFIELLDEMLNEHTHINVESVSHRIATMACKSAVKGNSEMSYTEATQLINELLSLENPYNCPHGRPTIIEYSKYDIEKKFKRIV